MIISKWGKTNDLETKADLPLWMDRSHAISSAISFNPCCAPTIVESESTELCESNNTVLKVASAKNNHLVTTSWNSSFNPLNNLPEKILLFYRQKKVSLSFSTRKTRKERRSDRSNVIFFFFFPNLSSVTFLSMFTKLDVGKSGESVDRARLNHGGEGEG